MFLWPHFLIAILHALIACTLCMHAFGEMKSGEMNVFPSSSAVSASSSAPLFCFSCTTLDAQRILAAGVRDPSWRGWLQQIRTVPRTAKCGDPFRTVSALRHGVRSTQCERGMCLKLWFREEGAEPNVWRGCVQPSGGAQTLREDCTRIISSQGEMEVCTCEGKLCNGAEMWKIRWVFILITLAITPIICLFNIFVIEFQ